MPACPLSALGEAGRGAFGTARLARVADRIAEGPVHIRLVTWDDDPPVGGQGAFARDLRTALVSLGTAVSTIAGRGPRATAYPRVTGRGHLDMAIALNRAPAALTTGGPDVVHVSGGPGGLLLLRRLDRPVVFTAHHTYRLAHGRFHWPRLMAPIERASYLRAARVVAVSPSTADSVVEMGVDRGRVVVIPSGIRLAGSGTEESEAGRMLFVGRLEPSKRPLDAVAAMQSVIEALPWARGYVVGEGSLFGAANRAAASIGDGKITVLGRLTDEEVARQYRLAEVVLVPSDYEGLGMVALEAMAAGAAVVGYDVVGLRDTIGQRGLLVDHADVGALAEATRRLLTDSALRSELVQRAGEAVHSERSWTSCAARYNDLYRDVLTR